MIALPGEREAGPCSKLVAVVDDDAPIRETLAELLEDEGYQVVAAADGREALEMLRRSTLTPCLILLDLRMPVMSGVQFRREQQQDQRLAAVPVCLISADSQVRVKAEELQCNFLEKPVRVQQVLAVIEQHCSQQR